VEYSSNPNPPNFGRVLRQLRQALRITQQELSDKSGLSEREIRNLELGRTRVPYRRSAQLLADALDLADEARAEFLSIARGDFPQSDLSHKEGKTLNHEDGSSELGTLQCEIVELRRECEALKHSLNLINEIVSSRERH
jgi:transcriptional regulator with XRE-family HTH domain